MGSIMLTATILVMTDFSLNCPALANCPAVSCSSWAAGRSLLFVQKRDNKSKNVEPSSIYSSTDCRQHQSSEFAVVRRSLRVLVGKCISASLS